MDDLSDFDEKDFAAFADQLLGHDDLEENLNLKFDISTIDWGGVPYTAPPPPPPPTFRNPPNLTVDDGLSDFENDDRDVSKSQSPEFTTVLKMMTAHAVQRERDDFFDSGIKRQRASNALAQNNRTRIVGPFTEKQTNRTILPVAGNNSGPSSDTDSYEDKEIGEVVIASKTYEEIGQKVFERRQTSVKPLRMPLSQSRLMHAEHDPIIHRVPSPVGSPLTMRSGSYIATVSPTQPEPSFTFEQNEYLATAEKTSLVAKQVLLDAFTNYNTEDFTRRNVEGCLGSDEEDV